MAQGIYNKLHSQPNGFGGPCYSRGWAQRNRAVAPTLGVTEPL